MSGAIQTICADPGWAFDDALPGDGRGAEKLYTVMGQRELCAFLDTEYLAGRIPAIADDARLFLWRVASMQQEALDVMKAWGFTLKTEIVWVKTSKASTATAWDAEQLARGDKLHIGMGRTTRAAHETCLVGARGRPARLDAAIRDVFFAPYEEHSRKPEVFYREIVEKVSPGPFLELFARRHREGWHCMGNQLPAVRP